MRGRVTNGMAYMPLLMDSLSDVKLETGQRVEVVSWGQWRGRQGVVIGYATRLWSHATYCMRLVCGAFCEGSPTS